MNKCTCCQETLDSEEIENPGKDEDGDIICDNCYNEKYCTTCVVCEEYFPLDDWNHFVIIDPENSENEIKTGLYKILEWPFYSSNTIGGDYIFENKVKRLCDHTQDIEESGEVCPECVKKMVGNIKKHEIKNGP